MVGRVDLVERHAVGPDHQCPAGLHRISSVHGEVEDHLAELAAVYRDDV